MPKVDFIGRVRIVVSYKYNFKMSFHAVLLLDKKQNIIGVGLYISVKIRVYFNGVSCYCC